MIKTKDMANITNYVKIAWRNLQKHRQFTTLNLVGLSSGIACAVLIYLWVQDERTIDKFNEKDSQLYQVFKTSPNADGTISTFGYTQGLLPKLMKDELPEVEMSVAVRAQNDGIISADGRNLKVKSDFVTKNFFKAFSYEILEGDRKNIFGQMSDVLISDQLAHKLFKTSNYNSIIGKSVSWDRGEFTGTYTIAGIFKSPPENASDQFDMVFNYDMYASKEAEDLAFWGSNGIKTYLVLKEGTDIGRFNNKIRDFTRNKIKSLPSGNEMAKWEGDVFVQKYSDKYLYNHFENGKLAGGRIEYVRLFSIIAIFILLLACINFMNLSTAKASQRMKEVGVRKVIGAARLSLIAQFLGESILLAILSSLVALVMVIVFLPAFKEYTGKNISLHPDPGLIWAVAIITLITGILSGTYPAFYLSGFQPVKVLKGKLITSSRESWIRKGLVVFQFSISIVLIVMVIVVYRQMQLIQNKNLGYNKDNIIRFSNDGPIGKNLQPFLTDLRRIPGIINVTDASGDFFGNSSHMGSGIQWEGKDPNLGIEYYGIHADFDFVETMGLKMVTGRSFSRDYADSSSVIFNESAVAAMGIKDPIGKIVSLWGDKRRIVGIVGDFNFQSLYKKISPVFLVFSGNNSNTLIRIKAGLEKNTLTSIENLYKKYNEDLPFDYHFLDDDFQLLYSSEQKITVLSRYFAGIAIIISCLGLFGLCAFTAQKRFKEIGIRKVVGASTSQIVMILSGDFLRLVLLALLIAIPVSFWAANEWLQSFAYRSKLSLGVFLATGLAVILITLVTISFQTLKAALTNPVNALRSE